jgi:hypothetical protein
MDLTAWREQMQRAIDDLADVELLYPKGRHVIFPPAGPRDLEELAVHVKPAVPGELAEFYRMCDGLRLPDVHNGYSIASAASVCRYIRQGEPTRVSDRTPSGVVMFGSDGGGGRFALRTEGQPEVLYLPNWGAVDHGMFDAALAPTEVLAPSLEGFLNRLIDDVRAFTRGDANWNFMAK